MKDFAGVAFFLLLAVAALDGLHRLANPSKRTAEDFERSVAESGTASGAVASALQDILQPEHARGRVVITQMKEGRFQKKRREGKADDSEDGIGSIDFEGGSTDYERTSD